MYVGVPTDPPPPPGEPGGRPPDPPTPKVWVNKGGGWVPRLPPYSPQSCRTPLGVTHWLAAAPVVLGQHELDMQEC